MKPPHYSSIIQPADDKSSQPHGWELSVNLKRVYRALLIVASLEQVILDRLACSLNLRLGGDLSHTYTPPVLVACGHGLRQNLHVDQGGNGLLLGVLDCSLQLVKGLDGVGLAAVSSADCSVIYLDYLAPCGYRW